MPLPTKSINALEIFGAGVFNGDKYTERDLDQMVNAFDKVGFQPTIKAGHQDGQESRATASRAFGEPSLGYVDRIYRKGSKLLADIRGIPARFADLISAGSYKRVSAEVYWDYKTPSQVYPRVLKAVAFLGADIPALTSLTAVESLFMRKPTGAVYAYSGGQEYRVYSTERHDYDGMSLGDYLTMVPRMTKVAANYRQAEGDEGECAACKYFISNMAACSIVEGYIQASGTSDLFEPVVDEKLARKLQARYSAGAMEADFRARSMEDEFSSALDKEGEQWVEKAAAAFSKLEDDELDGDDEDEEFDHDEEE